MTPERIRMILGIVFAAFLFSAGWATKGWKDNSEKLAIERATAASREASAQAAADAIAKIPQLTTKIYSGVGKSPTYTACTHTDEVWQTIGEALK